MNTLCRQLPDWHDSINTRGYLYAYAQSVDPRSRELHQMQSATGRRPLCPLRRSGAGMPRATRSALGTLAGGSEVSLAGWLLRFFRGTTLHDWPRRRRPRPFGPEGGGRRHEIVELAVAGQRRLLHPPAAQHDAVRLGPREHL